MCIRDRGQNEEEAEPNGSASLVGEPTFPSIDQRSPECPLDRFPANA